jgi:hypothetical protein
MAIQIGKYKRPGIFIEEIDRSIITSPTVEGGFANLVIGFSKKGPVNTAILLENLGDLERIFGSLDRQLERKGSFFHRTISKMLESSPVFAVNLLLTDDTLDTIEYQSLSASPIYNNDIERTAPYRKFFDTTGFWKRDTESFIDNTKSVSGYENRVLNLTNLSDRYITAFVFKSSITGFDRSLLEWYGSIEKLPPYVYSTDLASDYLVDVVVVGGDWSNYAELSVDPRWTQYFSVEGIKKSEIRNFANDRNITLLGYYEGLSLIPYFRDLNGRNIFIETIINRDTDRTGLFCAFNNDLFETDYPKGLIDLIGNTLVRDELLSNPPSSDETYYQSLDSSDGKSDGEISIDFLSYKEQITDTNIFSNRVLDRPGNVVAIFGTNSAVKLNTWTHSYNDSSNVLGGVISGPNDDVNLGYIAHPYRTYWFAEGYVNDFYRVGDFTTTTQSVSLQYSVNQTSDNGYAIIGGNYIPLAGTYSIQLSNLDYPQLGTSSGTQSYNIAYVIDTQGGVLVKKTTATGSRPTVSATDVVLGWGTVSLNGGLFVTGSFAPSITDVTIGLTVSNGSGADAYIPLSNGADYQFTTASTPQLILNSGDFKVEFLNTNSTPDVKQYEQYRRFKLFNSLLTYVNTSTSNRGLMLLNPQSDTEKKSLADITINEVKTGTTVNKSFVVRSGLSASVVNGVVSTGELAFYKIDDEFIIDYYGFETKNTLPLLTAGNTASIGVVGRFSNFYNQYNQGLVSTKDLFYQNALYDQVQVQFVPGFGITASLSGYNYLIFRVRLLNEDGSTRTYSSNNGAFFVKVEDLKGSLGDDLTASSNGYSFLIGGVLNTGSFENMEDSGLTIQNGFTLPAGPGGSSGGRAELLSTISGGVISANDSATFSYYAFEVKETLVDETLNASKIYGYASGFDDSPLYLRSYQKDNGDLVVNFVDYTLATQSSLASIESSNSGLETNGTIYVKSFKSNFKQTLEIEEPAGWIPFPNKVLVKRDRYSGVKVGDYLEASYDPSILATDQMPKKITRILGKRLWSGNSEYIELSCDSSIKIRTFNGDKQTTRYTKIDDYISTYKAISLKGFRIREASTPDGTDQRQSTILDIVAKGTTLFKALTNKEAFDFRYLIDSFGLGLTPDSKQQLVDICGDRLDAFGILNMPSLKQFKNSVSPTFKDANGNLQIEFIAQGGDPESNPEFLYSFGKGPGVTSVGYFLPYLTVDDFGRPSDVPPSAYVGLTFMRKHLSTTTSIVPWTIAAGVNNGRINGITDLEQIFTPSDLEFLNQAQMNPLTFKRNRGFVIETENTAQVLFKSALSLIHVREVLIELERELSRMLLDFQWTFNTPEIRAQIKLQADVICEKYVAQNGLFNYFNKIDEENNTAEIIDNQIGVLDTYVEPIKGMGIIVNNITILRTGAISAGGFINS